MDIREPTQEQKHIIMANMLFSDMWLVKEETPDMLVVVYRHGKTEKQLDKNVNLWKRRTAQCLIQEEEGTT